MVPIYEFQCLECGSKMERLQQIGTSAPICCNKPMNRLPVFPAMVKIKGEGGYPSRRKFVKGTAPNVSRHTKAWLSEDPYDKKVDYGFGFGSQSE